MDRLNNESSDRVYAPGGVGYELAKRSFNASAKEQAKRFKKSKVLTAGIRARATKRNHLDQTRKL